MLSQQVIEENAGAGAALPIDEARPAQIGDGPDAQRIARRQQQALLALRESHQCHRLSAEVALQEGDVVGRAYRLEEMAAGDMRLAAAQRD